MPNSFLSEADVRARLDPALLVTAIEAAFRDRYSAVTIPDRTQAIIPQGTFITMACCDRIGNALGIKLALVRNQPREAAPGEGCVHATYLLLDPETTEPRLTIAANYLTDLRTAATSAVATKFLALPDATTLGIFGTGRQARAHLRVMPLVRPFRQVLVCGQTEPSSAEFVREVLPEMPGITVTATDARTCAAESDVLCTCTTSPDPLFDGGVLRAGTHLNLVGAFQPHTREVDTHTIKHARVVVDTYVGARTEMGELLIPLREGAISGGHVASDLHELVSGKKEGRRNREEVTVFKSVGCALEDLVAAEVLMATQP